MAGEAKQPPEWLRAEARRLYGTDPTGYDAGRPEYPERVYGVLTGRCGLGPGTAALEIGPGTGRVTRRLVGCGARVVAVEPDPAMAAHLDRTIPDGVEVIVDTFEDARLPVGAFDLAVAATSAHWVDRDVGMPKLGRVLRPGGWAAVWWTIFGDPDRPDPFHDAIAELLSTAVDAIDGDRVGPAFELDAAARRADLARRAGLVDVDSELIRWTARLDPGGVRALYSSMIVVLRRPPAERKRLLDALASVAANEFGGAVVRPFVTALYVGRRPYGGEGAQRMEPTTAADA